MEPYDGGEYDSVMQIPGTNRLLLTYLDLKSEERLLKTV